MRLVAIAMLMLSACQQTPSPNQRTVKLVLTDNIRAECGKEEVLEPFGCAKLHGDVCTIVAARPSGFDDHERIKTIGHELWHCFTGPEHR